MLILYDLDIILFKIIIYLIFLLALEIIVHYFLVNK